MLDGLRVERPTLGGRQQDHPRQVRRDLRAVLGRPRVRGLRPRAIRRRVGAPRSGPRRAGSRVATPSRTRTSSGVLDELAAERAHGHHKNLVVAATGTGKTVVAALDYARLRKEWGDATLLFIAHREEILARASGRFRAVLRDGALRRDARRRSTPDQLDARVRDDSVARTGSGSKDLDPTRTTSSSSTSSTMRPRTPTTALLAARPTARCCSGSRRRRNAPTARACSHGSTGASRRRSASGRRSTVGLLSPVPVLRDRRRHRTQRASTVRAAPLRRRAQLERPVHGGPHVARTRARGKPRTRSPTPRDACARVLRGRRACASSWRPVSTSRGVPAVAVTAGVRARRTRDALRKLADGESTSCSAVDLFNEGVDVPAVDTVLFLRPTESATVFLQQLGRGLRLGERQGRAHGPRLHRRRASEVPVRRPLPRARRRHARGGPAFDRGRLPVSAGGMRHPSRSAEPGGGARNVRAALASNWRSMAEDLAHLGDVRMPVFLADADLELEDLVLARRAIVPRAQACCGASARRGGDAPVACVRTDAARRRR